MQKKINKIIDQLFCNELLISDGKQSTRMIFDNNDENKKTTIDRVQEVEVKNITETIEVPYGIIDNAPIFPECKDLPNNDERKKCTSNNVAKFVNKSFNLDLAASLGLVGRQRIFVSFKIDKKGNVAAVSARAAHPALEEEAKRVIKLLPQFVPGTQKGKPVVVPYSLPILFQVASDKKDKN